MSTIAKPRTLPAGLNRKAALWRAGAILATAVIVVLALSITGSEAEKAAPAAGSGQAAAGRYDGGPEGRTPGLSAAQPPGPERRDGGLEEGARGPTPFSGPR